MINCQLVKSLSGGSKRLLVVVHNEESKVEHNVITQTHKKKIRHKEIVKVFCVCVVLSSFFEQDFLSKLPQLLTC